MRHNAIKLHYLQVSAATKRPDAEHHAGEVCQPYFERLADLWPKIVISLRMVEYVNASDSYEDEVDETYDSELYGRLPVKEEPFERKPDQVDH